MFCFDLFKDFSVKLLKYIKDTDHIKKDIVEYILPRMLNKFDQHFIAINLVHHALSEHQKNKSIKCKEKTVKKIVEKVVHASMKHFTSYISNYGELSLDSDDNMSSLQTTNINTITAQAHRNMPEYALPKSFASLESMLGHWGQYITVNEERHNLS